MSKLVSVNVGKPRDVPWRGKTVYTGIWKAPVDGPVMVRRLNIDGDGQGDLVGHGGEQRAVMVYQSESYDFWKNYLGRDDLAPGHFGENFTVTGLPDDEVCIGDRYRIGDAEFEVTQPRVTCFRVGIRIGVPEMPNLLVTQHRPGFYLRVVAEGEVRAGDGIVRTRRGRHAQTVAAVDGLLYLPGRDTERLRAAVDIPALSPGWRQSLRDMLAAGDEPAALSSSANGLAWNGFRVLRVAAVSRESPEVVSLRLVADDDGALPAALPGQYLTIRVPGAGEPVPLRSYSLSDPRDYRISIKRDDHGAVSRWLHAHAEPGLVVEAAAPRGDFHLAAGDGPVVLCSAGIGITPVLAMLQALSSTHSEREVFWLHVTRNRRTEVFATEVAALLQTLPRARQRVVFTETDGRPDRAQIVSLGLPADAAAYVCGPAAFMADIREALIAAGLDGASIHSELFGALPPINPGVVVAGTREPPHPPPGEPGTGPPITFARSGLTVNWAPKYGTLLDFAEACDVPTRFSCRSGVCHTCQTGVVAGAVAYNQPPLLPPEPGTVLTCLAAPTGDLVLDL